MNFFKRIFNQSKNTRFEIYVGENCHDCDKVIIQLKKMKKQFKVIDLDKSNKTAPIPLFVLPAMFVGDKLIAYGFDILKKA